MKIDAVAPGEPFLNVLSVGLNALVALSLSYEQQFSSSGTGLLYISNRDGGSGHRLLTSAVNERISKYQSILRTQGWGHER
jgi:hypothetical protein